MNLSFTPISGLRSGVLQTILGSLIPTRELPAVHLRYTLSDGTTIVNALTTPLQWRPWHPTAVLVHGMGGHASAGYMNRFARRLVKEGFRVIRVNLRDMGLGYGYSHRPYHGGGTEDLLEILQQIHADTPSSKIGLIGFSLGGNTSLKLAGQLGEEGNNLISQLIAVCPPLHLPASSWALALKKHRLLERYFLKAAMVSQKIRNFNFPWAPLIYRSHLLHWYDYDRLYSAPVSGFPGALALYEDGSSLPWLEKIRIPTHMLFAIDDPIVPILDFLPDLKLPPSVQIWKTETGGHMGFLGTGADGKSYLWMYEQLTEWLKQGLCVI